MSNVQIFGTVVLLITVLVFRVTRILLQSPRKPTKTNQDKCYHQKQKCGTLACRAQYF